MTIIELSKILLKVSNDDNRENLWLVLMKDSCLYFFEINLNSQRLVSEQLSSYKKTLLKLLRRQLLFLRISLLNVSNLSVN